MSYTKNEAIEVLNELADDLGRSPSQNDFEEYTGHSWWDVGKHFESWNEAKRAAGLEEYQGGHEVIHTESDIIDQIQELEEKLGRTPTVGEFESEESVASIDVVQRRLGSWTDAVKEAGFDPIRESYNHNSEYFSSLNSGDTVYWLGMLFGDGSICPGTDSNEVQLTLKDREHIAEFRDQISPKMKIRSTGKTHLVSLEDALMHSDLVDHGMEDRSIPDVPDSLKNDFVRGFFDADGSATHNFVFYNSKVELLEKVSEWIPTEAYHINSYRRDDRKRESQLTIRERGVDPVIDWMYPNGIDTEPALSRKKERLIDA